MNEGQTNTVKYIRERDHLKLVELWEPVDGRMMKLPKKPPSARASADAAVAGK